MSFITKIFGSLFGGLEKPPAPLPPLPTREDPEIEQARKRAQIAEKLRRGRRSTILTSGRGVEDQLGSVSRPEARGGATLLGG